MLLRPPFGHFLVFERLFKSHMTEKQKTSHQKPLVGLEALQYVNREFVENGSTMYFLSFVNKIPKPKETFDSYRQFLIRSQNRLETLADYSEHLHSVAVQKQLAAQRLISTGSFDNQTIQQLFSPVPVRQVIPRSKKYQEIRHSMFVKPANNRKDVYRLLAAIVSKPKLPR